MDLDDIMDFLKVDEIASSPSILEITSQDLQKISEIEEKITFVQINKSESEKLIGVEHYQVERWKAWLLALQSLRLRKKKFELDCLEELTKTSIVSFVSNLLAFRKWM